MAFVTGTANSFADLLTAVQNACTANGYTLTGNVLSKGSLYAQVSISGSNLAVIAGTGQSAGVLSGTSDVGAAMLGFATSGTALSTNGFTFPMPYYCHIGVTPDEVTFIVNPNGTQYQYIAFGQSSVGGLVGSGNWFAGSCPGVNATTMSTMDIRSIGGYMQLGGYLNSGLFQGLQGNPASQNGAVDHKLDTATWAVNGGAWFDAFTLLKNLPSSWNGESSLVPVQIHTARPSGFYSMVAELAHARFVMLDNLTDQQIITLGSDRWKVYPWWKRGLRGVYTADTGTLGHAIRYDGP